MGSNSTANIISKGFVTEAKVVSHLKILHLMTQISTNFHYPAENSNSRRKPLPQTCIFRIASKSAENFINFLLRSHSILADFGSSTYHRTPRQNRSSIWHRILLESANMRCSRIVWMHQETSISHDDTCRCTEVHWWNLTTTFILQKWYLDTMIAPQVGLYLTEMLSKLHRVKSLATLHPTKTSSRSDQTSISATGKKEEVELGIYLTLGTDDKFLIFKNITFGIKALSKPFW